MLCAHAGIEKILATEGVLGLGPELKHLNLNSQGQKHRSAHVGQGLALRDGALRPSLGLTALGECHAVGCATQRLARPEAETTDLGPSRRERVKNKNEGRSNSTSSRQLSVAAS